MAAPATTGQTPASPRPTTADGELPERLRTRLRSRVVAGGPREEIEVRAPFTEAVLGTVPRCTAEDVGEATARARRAQRRWRETGFGERAEILMAFHDLVLERSGEVLDLIQLETGKVRGDAYEEVADAAMVAAYYARTGESHLRPRRREGALPLLTRTEEVRHPRGVVGFIAPWNYPLSMAITDAIPALMAGNAAVLKPARQTPFTALWTAALMAEAGLPEGLLTVVTGTGSELGTPLIEAVDFVTFTGSTATGRIVAEQAGRQLIDCALELGGKNAMVVMADADLDRAVEGAVGGCFASAGQLCISIERLYVHEAVRDEFTRLLVERVEELELAAGLGWGGDMGSLVSRDQLETVTRHVEDAVDHGATVLTGGEPRPDVGPLFYAPTVLTDVAEAAELYAAETFGPVVTIYPFEETDEAVAAVNASDYGLNASLFTRDTRRGREIAARLEAGTVNINEAYAAAWASVDAPMGGFKDSGVGRRHGREGIWKYTELQTIATQRLMPVTGLPGLSDEQVATVLRLALKAMHSIPGLRRP